MKIQTIISTDFYEMSKPFKENVEIALKLLKILLKVLERVL